MKITKLLKSLNTSVIVYASILITFLVIIALMMRPIADDFGYFSDPLVHNPIKFTINYYMVWTGRSGQAFLMSSLYDIFRSRVVIYGTILLTLLLMASTTLLTYITLYKERTSHQKLIALSLLSTVVFIFTVPSIFDSNLWITSSTVYIGSLVAMLIAISITVLYIRANLVKKRYYVLLSLIVFVAQLFSEPTSLIMIYLGVAGVILSRYIIKSTTAQHASLTFLVSSILGLLYMYLSPGTRARQGAVGVYHSGLVESLVHGFSDLSKMSYIFTSYRILMVVILGLFIALTLTKVSKRITVIVTLMALISSVVVSFSFFFMMRYTLGSFIPERAFTATSGVVCILLAIAIGATVSYYKWQKLSQLNTYLPILLFILLPISLGSALLSNLPTLHAVAIRSDLYDTRDMSIKRQVAEGGSVVYVEPLPMLLSNSDAVDFHYDRGTPLWYEQAFRRYYNIPNSTHIILTPQSQDYCTLTSNPGWLGAKDCLQLREQP